MGIVGPSYQWANKFQNFVRNYSHSTDLHSAIIMKFFLYEMPLKVSLFLGSTVLGEAKPSCVYKPEQKSAEGRFLEGKLFSEKSCPKILGEKGRRLNEGFSI